MAKKRRTLVFQLCGLFLVCMLSAIVGIALRRNGESAVNVDRQPSVQQSDEKVIEVKEFPNQPFELSDLSVKELNILSGQKINVATIAESEGWLDNLKFNIKNKWDKQIVFIKIDLEFPETWLAGRPLMIDQLRIGIHPQATENDKKYGKALALNPGETITYSHSKHRLELTKNFLAQGGFHLANMNKVVIKITDIFFNDGTAWGHGNWFKKNPNVPGGYELIRQ